MFGVSGLGFGVSSQCHAASVVKSIIRGIETNIVPGARTSRRLRSPSRLC